MRRAIGLFLAAVVLVPALAGCSADPAPHDLCGLIGGPLLDQMAPGAGTPMVTRDNSSVANQVTCGVGSPTGARPFGSLQVELTRLSPCFPDDGGTACNTRRIEADRFYEPLCDRWRINPETMGAEVAVPGLGERSCAVARTDPKSGLVTVHLVSQVAGDVVFVQYDAWPSTEQLAVRAASAVVDNVWARL
ncbi:hypothetical protein R8Z50_08555 [Longispora sp. K20-0274]|uniref:hypothetical protein n=1 Tax=Longispora sp. K20-0274 TaxID=3088255 RepID=UPI003999C094